VFGSNERQAGRGQSDRALVKSCNVARRGARLLIVLRLFTPAKAGACYTANSVVFLYRCHRLTKMEILMHECRFTIPTYNANLFPTEVATGRMPEFGSPYLPVLVHQAEGIRVILGPHDRDDLSNPDIQIERQPNGWAIFLHPVGGSDASGYVYFHDDGRSFLIPENAIGPTPAIKALKPTDKVPGFDPPVEHQQR